MKNKSILSVWHVVCGSSKKKEKRYMHMALVVLALFTVASVHAARLTQPGAAGTGTVKKSPSRPLSPAQRRATARKTVGQPAKQTTSTVPSTDAGWKFVGSLLAEDIPFSPQVWKKYHEGIRLSPEQDAFLQEQYKQKEIANNQKLGYQQYSSQWQQLSQQQQQAQIPFSPVGVAAGAGMLAAQGVEQGTSLWERLKGAAGSVWQGVFGEYGSSLGYFKYALPAAAFVAGGPVGWLTGTGLATTALMSGGSAAALLALTTATDRLNFAAQTGGHFSTASALEDIKEKLLFALGNDAAYPYLVARKEALRDGLELVPVVNDATGISRQAHIVLWQEFDKKFNEAAINNPVVVELEKQFEKNVVEIRQKNGYGQLPNNQYIANLQSNNNNLIQAQALVSEYNRALNRARMEAIRATKMAGFQVPVVTPMQQPIPEASESTTVPLTTTGTLRD